MRLALQRLLANSSAISVLRNAVLSHGAGFCQHYSNSPTTQARPTRYTAKESEQEQPLGSEARTFRIRKIPAMTKDDENSKDAIERNQLNIPAHLPNPPGSEGVGLSRSTGLPTTQMVPATQHGIRSSNASSSPNLRLPSTARRNNEGWRSRLVTLEQYQHESNLGALTLQGPRLVDDPSYTQDWELWLELIVFRRRHHGAKGTVAIYKEIFKRDMRLPTEGVVANQLWGLLIRAGFHDYGILEETIVYALRLKRSTGRSWSRIYYGIVSITLKKDPASAYSWHVKLRNDFPPSLEDYQKIFKLSLDCGRSAHFKDQYKDTPLLGMYKTVIGHLCKLQMYAEALKWHDLLCEVRDFPAEFTDIQPLLDHLVYIGDRTRFESIVRQLAKANIGISNMAEDIVQNETSVSREIMNRQLGEVHGVAPKHLSDGFCSRLFATRLFAVDTIINGLQMMATEAIGPLSLREIAVRDDCDPGTICNHIDHLRNAGISLDDSAFCTVIQGLAAENKHGILNSVVNCDLHPDTFADYDLQERLLAQYYEENDLVKIERTLAILTTGCSVDKLQLIQKNLVLRCQISLGRREEALATLEEMKQVGITVSARSSRHLRVCWLSRRQVGRRPAETQELTLLIQASQMTMQGGSFVPIIAWREILRRLGMTGRLTELENLALWLVDWYSSLAAKAALPKRMLLSGHGRQQFIDGHVSTGTWPHRSPQRFLNILFTIAAQHAIVAWGFQRAIHPRKTFRRFKNASTTGDPPRLEGTARFQWTWGLHLLYKLRERGVPIRRRTVARICRHRLNTLFGTGISKRKINRRARAEMLEFSTETVYIRKMEEIWGEDLFKVWRSIGKNLEKRLRRNFRRGLRRSRRERQMRSNGHEAVQIVYNTPMRAVDRKEE